MTPLYHTPTPRIPRAAHIGWISYAAVLRLFREGLDTVDIAARLKTSESVVHNLLAKGDA